jgi:hypothetical protein
MLSTISSLNTTNAHRELPNLDLVKKLLDEYHERNEKLIESKFAMINNILVTNENVESYINSIDDLLLKYGRLCNHAKITQSHLNAKTAPASLSHLKFPRPMFQDDPIYVENYTAFLDRIQEQFLLFQKEQIQNKIEKAQADLTNLKQLISVKIPNVEKLFQDRKLETEQLLKDDFVNSDNKVKTIIASKWQSTNSLRVKNNVKNRKPKKNSHVPGTPDDFGTITNNDIESVPPTAMSASRSKVVKNNSFPKPTPQPQQITAQRPRQQHQNNRFGTTHPVPCPTFAANGPILNTFQPYIPRMPTLQQNGNFRVPPHFNQVR